MYVLGSILGLPFVYFMHDKIPETKMYSRMEKPHNHILNYTAMHYVAKCSESHL